MCRLVTSKYKHGSNKHCMLHFYSQGGNKERRRWVVGSARYKDKVRKIKERRERERQAKLAKSNAKKKRKVAEAESSGSDSGQ